MLGCTADPGCRVIGMPVAYGLETFKDRVHERAEVIARLSDPRARMVAIIGRRGIGKSALAAKVAEQLASDGTGEGRAWAGIVNVSSRTSGISLERIFHDCARLPGPGVLEDLLEVWTSQRGTSDKVAQLFAALSGGPYLILLDNFEDRLDDRGELRDRELTEFFDAFFRTRHGARILMTTQVPLVLPPELRRYQARLYLDQGLPVPDAVELLCELDADGETDIVRASRQDLERAVRRVYGVPRALELIAGALSEDYLTLPTLDEVLETFVERGDVIAYLAQDRFQRLDAESRLVLEVLAAVGRPATRDAVSWVLGPLAPDVDVPAALARLASHGRMVTVDRARRMFALHPMDADFIYGELPRDGLLGYRSLNRRVADWYARQKPPRDQWRSVDDVQLHRYEFAHRIRAEDYEPAAAVLDEVDNFLTWRGSVGAARDMHQQLSGRLHDEETGLAHLVGFGLVLLVGGPHHQAAQVLGEAVDLAERLGDQHRLAQALFALGDTYRQLNQLDEAIGPLQRAVELEETLGDPERLLRALMSLSLARSYRGEVQEALDVAETMRATAVELSDDLGRAQANDAAACAHLASGDWSRALAMAVAAIALYEEVGVTEALGYVHNVQGVAFLGLGDVERAEAEFLQANTDGAAVGSPRTEGICLYNLSWAYWTVGRYADALTAAQRSTAAFERAAATGAEVADKLARAARAVLAGEAAEAARHLRAAAEKSRGNADFVPPAWLLAEAERLTAQRLTAGSTD
ncbi:tetratricopeptide repeat protein [Streptomyces roseoverticillatus]|uniref:tetratricopeptide repeat protein n=1 Tax=Streptomyces roseoverticillatus TaxID=66429 RepID=UPI001F2DDD87|nr:tetratricopeptide repeat protein [Streptomyces roseoverticillatus]MCF3102352.1 tetratricopeptide repeat protein [Streptomyces roseoverticillatus]